MAIKFTEFFHRRPGMTATDFLNHWQQQHTGVVSAVDAVRRYIQNPAMGLLEGAPNPYDGMVEVWFDDLAAIERLRKSDYWETIVEDELRFVDRPSLQLFLSEESVPELPVGGCKRVYLLHRLAGQTSEEFEARARADVRPADVPGLVALQRMLPVTPGTDSALCADAVEIWRFETLALLEAGMRNDAILAVCRKRGEWAMAGEALTTEERIIR